VIFIVLLGGQGTLLGPIVGAFTLIMMEDILPGFWTRWPMLLGILFVVLSVSFRGGIMGFVKDRLL
jgi:branched-chain amino acid transport system permease protein